MLRSEYRIAVEIASKPCEFSAVDSTTANAVLGELAYCDMTMKRKEKPNAPCLPTRTVLSHAWPRRVVAFRPPIAMPVALTIWFAITVTTVGCGSTARSGPVNATYPPDLSVDCLVTIDNGESVGLSQSARVILLPSRRMHARVGPGAVEPVMPKLTARLHPRQMAELWQLLEPAFDSDDDPNHDTDATDTTELPGAPATVGAGGSRIDLAVHFAGHTHRITAVPGDHSAVDRAAAWLVVTSGVVAVDR